MIKYFIIHHSVTGHNVPDSIVKSWGYDKIIMWDGRILDGLGHAHTYGHNYDSLGVCLIGNFEIENPTSQQIDSLIKQLKLWMKSYPNAIIVGHKDLANNPPGYNFTACPGKNLHALISDIIKMLDGKNLSRNHNCSLFIAIFC